MKSRSSLLCLLFPLALAGCSLWPFVSKRDDFIRVRGTHFIHNERPYYFAGANMWHGCHLGSPGPTGDRPRLQRELDSLVAAGLLNLRVLAASEESALKRSVKPALQRAPGLFDDSLMQGMDYLLAAMADRHMHAVLYLNNYWEWSGGMAQYNVWTEGGSGVDPEDSTGGSEAFMNFSAAFYANQKANLLYRECVRRIVQRRNTVNGRVYAEDPTIMAWQLANEPRPGTNGPEGERNLPALSRWLDETSAYLHSLDTNHLVSTGSEGSVAFRWSSDVYLSTHRPKQIDYLTFHVWPKNWGWFDPIRFDETLARATDSALAYASGHLSYARQLARPIVMEEYGLARDGGVCPPGTPTTARDRYFATLLCVLYDSARAGAPFAGSNLWAWGGERLAQRRYLDAG